MKTIIPLIPLVFLMAGGLTAVPDAPVNANCPVTGEAAARYHAAVYTKTAHFCCKECKEAFRNHPDSHVAALAAFDPQNGHCLLCERTADATLTEMYSRKVAFCCEKCPLRFRSAPDKYIARAVLDRRPVNALCPLDGANVRAAHTVQYRKEVWFCSGSCRETFHHDPDAAALRIAAWNLLDGKCLHCGRMAFQDHHVTYARVIACCSEACAGKVRADPDKFIARAVKHVEPAVSTSPAQEKRMR